jgi:hypothetical protein
MKKALIHLSANRIPWKYNFRIERDKKSFKILTEGESHSLLALAKNCT